MRTFEIEDSIAGLLMAFFTTQPTDQGMGFGLSLSYDIAKMQGGQLKLETLVGKGSTFIINLSFKNSVL